MTRRIRRRCRGSQAKLASISHGFLVTCERVQDARGTHLPVAGHRRRCISVLHKQLSKTFGLPTINCNLIEIWSEHAEVVKFFFFRNFHHVEVLFWKEVVLGLPGSDRFYFRASAMVIRQSDPYFDVSRFSDFRHQFIAQVEHTQCTSLKLLLVQYVWRSAVCNSCPANFSSRRLGAHPDLRCNGLGWRAKSRFEDLQGRAAYRNLLANTGRTRYLR